jgi:Uma2 family endonuclease
MSTALIPRFVTIEEFDTLPDQDEHVYELYEGELIEVTFPNWIHSKLQERIRALLQAVVENTADVLVEMPFQISNTPKQTKRRADVGYIRAERDRLALEAGALEGAPDLVVEVLSPSNSASKLNRYVRLCLANGAAEVWIVDPETKTVRVRQRDRTEREYEPGESISFGAGRVGVADVFNGIV